MLSTKFTHNEIRSNKFDLSRQLDKLTNKVLDRGIYVIEKNNYGFYNLLEYTKKKSIITDIPGYKLADSICNSFNNKHSSRKNNSTFVQSMINMYHKLNNDCMFYRNTITTTKDEFKREVTITRLDIAVQQLKNVYKELSTLK